MALTIPPAFCTDQPYPFSILRKQMASVAGPGIIHTGDMAVSPASGLQVQIAAGEAYVQQTGATEGTPYNGLYYEINDAPANPFNTISAPLVNPRIDFVVLRVYDVTELGISGSSFARYEWVQGSENASASLGTMGPGLSNPGAPSVPTSSMLCAYVLQTVGESSISSGNILNVAPLSGKPASGTLAQRPASGSLGARYFATDTAFEYTYNGSTWLGLGQSPVVPRPVTSAATAVSGQLIEATGTFTVTMPSPAVSGQMVGITNSGSGTITVSTPSGVFEGVGLAASSFLLGTKNATVLAVSDGTNWVLIGQQNTGWIAMTTFPSGWTTNGPRAKLEGNRVYLDGSITNASGSTFVSGSIASFATSMKPTVTQAPITLINNSAASIVINAASNSISAVGVVNGATVNFYNISFPID